MSRKAKMVLDKEFQIAPIDMKEFISRDIRRQMRMDSAKM